MLGVERLRNRLARGEFSLTLHALGQMQARRITVEAILACAAAAAEFRPQPDNETLRVVGPLEGTNKNLVIVCALHGEVLVVVTVHPERRKAK
jgi:hypothetical protein